MTPRRRQSRMSCRFLRRNSSEERSTSVSTGQATETLAQLEGTDSAVRVSDQQHRLLPVEGHVGALALDGAVLRQGRVPVLVQVVDERLFLRQPAEDRGLEGRPAHVDHFLPQVEGHQRGAAADVPNAQRPVGRGREEDLRVEGVVLDLVSPPCTRPAGAPRTSFGIAPSTPSSTCGCCLLPCPE